MRQELAARRSIHRQEHSMSYLHRCFQGYTDCIAGGPESTLPEALATRSEPAKTTSIRPEPRFPKAPSVAKPSRNRLRKMTLHCQRVSHEESSTKATSRARLPRNRFPLHKRKRHHRRKKSIQGSGPSDVVNQVPENSAVANDDAGALQPTLNPKPRSEDT